ncbi:MAG: LPS-assembly protein LptD, partial [Bacteroidetes bacterium]
MWSPVIAQEPATTRDSLPPARPDSLVFDLRPVRISTDALDAQVDYGAKDSMWFDVKNRQLHLYGQAYLKYTSIDLKAGYILLDYEKNEVTAEQFPDATGKMTGLPEFKDGEQTFTATKIRYNFRSKKGIIYEARTLQQDLYVLGQKAKFVSQEVPDTTIKTQNTVYNQNALLTTCDHPEPHYGIRTKKLKVIPDKLVVTGFSNVEIGGIPTPLVLPFGFYPVTKTRKSGLIIPRDFEFADREGLGIKDWGYYFPISD